MRGDAEGFGFRVQGLGSGDQGSGSRVWGSGFRVQGLGFGVHGVTVGVGAPPPRGPPSWLAERRWSWGGVAWRANPASSGDVA